MRKKVSAARVASGVCMWSEAPLLGTVLSVAITGCALLPQAGRVRPPGSKAALAGNGSADSFAGSASIKALNHSPARNRAARNRFLECGGSCVPALIEELSLAAGPRADRKGIVRAVRALRAIREIGSPEALEACGAILLHNEYATVPDAAESLMSEAVLYLGEHFSIERARDIYARFVLSHRHKYTSRMPVQPYWGSARTVTVFCVDVLSAVPQFIVTRDKLARPALRTLVDIMTSDSYGGHALHLLDDDGFTIRYRRWRPGKSGRPPTGF